MLVFVNDTEDAQAHAEYQCFAAAHEHFHVTHLCNPGNSPHPLHRWRTRGPGPTEANLGPTEANVGPTLRACCSQDMSMRDIFKGQGPIVVGKKIQCAAVTAPFAGASGLPSTIRDKAGGCRRPAAETPAASPGKLRPRR